MRNASNLINPNARAEGPPPNTFTAFFIWAFKGSFRYMALGSFVSVIAGVLEVLSALILGLVIDAALDVDRTQFFDTNMGLLLGVVAFFIVVFH